MFFALLESNEQVNDPRRKIWLKHSTRFKYLQYRMCLSQRQYYVYRRFSTLQIAKDIHRSV